MSKSNGYGVEVCRNCDPMRPEHVWAIGPEVESLCPECGAHLFGLIGTEDSPMLLSQAFAGRDMMHKQALFAEFGGDPEMINRINVAFKNGLNDWPVHMTAVFGRDDVDRLMIITHIEVAKLYDGYRAIAWRLWVRFLWGDIKDSARRYFTPWRRS